MRHRILSRLRRFSGDESGTSTVEFAFAFFILFITAMSGVEQGMMTLKQTMLERGLDLAVRDLRLISGNEVQHADIKDRICSYAGFIPDCEETLRLEMKPTNLRSNYVEFTNSTDCIDRSEEVTPVRQFTNGGQNELMLLRACVKIKPIFPGAGLGKQVMKDGNGEISIFSLSAFVNEPK
ncbi:TadE/TadG family type IV pilus assembly protein [Pseudooceanicola aestuarii]|uniref:TadE/TadG family type IV pilus assembly protein n=1 Tax=Pseudooceanicola aestuarii TaxID=2697319 RepID=UPI0013D72167|nr:pilus assembly protein [Pseudooceanicola aestuarii]